MALELKNLDEASPPGALPREAEHAKNKLCTRIVFLIKKGGRT